MTLAPDAQRPRARTRAIVLAAGLLSLAACATNTPTGASTPTASALAPAPRPGVSVTPTGPSSPDSTSAPTRASASPSVVEPTTTNTLPPPPRPSKPAPSTAGKLSATSLPVPTGWKTIARKGGEEEGYEGNGTWVHARDPRYAAQAVITVGCADVTRDDYPDPAAALEGTYDKSGEPGIGLVLQFANHQRASAFYRTYLQQVRACTGGDGPVRTKILPSRLGLIDQRTASDGDWTEVGALAGSRLTLVILSDPRLRISRRDSENLLHKILTG